MFESLQMIPSPPAKRGEAKRTNGEANSFEPSQTANPDQSRWDMGPPDRFSTTSTTFANTLYHATGIGTLVTDWPSVVHPSRTPRGLSENIRIYSYKEGELFVRGLIQSKSDETNLNADLTLACYRPSTTMSRNVLTRIRRGTPSGHFSSTCPIVKEARPSSIFRGDIRARFVSNQRRGWRYSIDMAAGGSA